MTGTEEFRCSDEQHPSQTTSPKRKTRDIHTRVYCDDYEYMYGVVGEGYISHEIRELMSMFRKKHGNPREALLTNIKTHETELEYSRQALIRLDETLAQKEKDEQEHNAKREEVIAMLVNASRRHARTNPLLWQTASETSGLSVLELRKIVKEKLKESELNEN